MRYKGGGLYGQIDSRLSSRRSGEDYC
ncbi:hypothetical protein M3J09_007584 [Ascochyta lentis]